VVVSTTSDLDGVSTGLVVVMTVDSVVGQTTVPGTLTVVAVVTSMVVG